MLKECYSYSSARGSRSKILNSVVQPCNVVRICRSLHVGCLSIPAVRLSSCFSRQQYTQDKPVKPCSTPNTADAVMSFGDMGVSQSLGTLRPHSLMDHRDCKESVGFYQKDSILQGGRWEVGGGKWEDRRKWLRTDSKGRCRSHRFGHGMKAPFEKPPCITVYDKRLFELFRSICYPEEFLIKGLAAYARKPLRLCKTLAPPNSNGDATQLL